MAGYIESVLPEEEKIVYRAAMSLWPQAKALAWSALFLGLGYAMNSAGALAPSGRFATFLNDPLFTNWIPDALYVACVVMFFVAYANYVSREMVITTHRLISKTGILKRRVFEIRISRAESVNVSQSLAGRMLDFGSVVVSAAGAPMEIMSGVRAPQEFCNVCMERIVGASGD